MAASQPGCSSWWGRLCGCAPYPPQAAASSRWPWWSARARAPPHPPGRGGCPACSGRGGGGGGGLGAWVYLSVSPALGNPAAATLLSGWASPNFHDWSAPLFEAEVILVLILWTVSGGPDRFSAIVGFALLMATFFAEENLGIFAIFVAPQLAVHGARAWTRPVAPRIGTRRFAAPRHVHPIASSAVLVAMTALMAAVVVPRLSASAAASYQATNYPEAAGGYVATPFSGQRIYTIDP